MYEAVQERFIELCVLSDDRVLNAMEYKEIKESFTYLKNRYWKLDKLKGLSLLASEKKDVDWQHEICSRIERLEGRG